MKINYNNKFRKVREVFNEMKLLIGSGLFLISLPFVFDIDGNVGVNGIGVVFLIVGLYIANSSEELKNEPKK